MADETLSPRSPEGSPGGLPPVPPQPPTAASPSWKELTEFINKQAEQNRAVIDYWFKLAVAILGLIFVVCATGVGIFGFKTLEDARSAATKAATKTATEAASRIATEYVQNNPGYVEDAMKDLLQQGAFAEEIKREIQSQVRAAAKEKLGKTTPDQAKEEIKTPNPGARGVNASLEGTFASRLKQYSGKTVRITACPDGEPTAFATSLSDFLRTAGLSPALVTTPNACDAHPVRIVARDGQLLEVLDDLLKAAGERPLLQPGKTPYGPEEAVIVIGSIK
jgi:hypothetical protein